ncbi:MAG: RNA polymerase sigma factor [Pirellulaceae bacterium]
MRNDHRTVPNATGLGDRRDRARTLPPDVELQLLRSTQSYLRSLCLGGQPAADLREAWDAFHRRHAPLVQRVVAAYGLEGHDAEDCAQEIWITVLQSLERSTYRPGEGRFCCWVVRVIHNRAIDFVRSAARRRLQLRPDLDGMMGGDQPDPVRVTHQAVQRDLVTHVLRHLRDEVSATNYQIVELRWMHGLDVAQVAAQLDLTREQVRYRHYRVKRRLRALLDSHGQEPP